MHFPSARYLRQDVICLVCSCFAKMKPGRPQHHLKLLLQFLSQHDAYIAENNWYGCTEAALGFFSKIKEVVKSAHAFDSTIHGTPVV